MVGGLSTGLDFEHWRGTPERSLLDSRETRQNAEEAPDQLSIYPQHLSMDQKGRSKSRCEDCVLGPKYAWALKGAMHNKARQTLRGMPRQRHV